MVVITGGTGIVNFASRLRVWNKTYVDNATPTNPNIRKIDATSSSWARMLTPYMRAMNDSARAKNTAIIKEDDMRGCEPDAWVSVISFDSYCPIPMLFPMPAITILSPSFVFSNTTVFILSMTPSIESKTSLRKGETASPMSSFITTAFIGM